MPLPSLAVDRPFLFFIVDQPTGAILFAGRVVNPSDHLNQGKRWRDGSGGVRCAETAGTCQALLAGGRCARW